AGGARARAGDVAGSAHRVVADGGEAGERGAGEVGFVSGGRLCGERRQGAKPGVDLETFRHARRARAWTGAGVDESRVAVARNGRVSGSRTEPEEFAERKFRARTL